MKKVAFLLPDVESYNSYYGGACARWVGSVMPFLSDFDFSVLARGHERKFIYPGNLITTFLSTFVARFKSFLPFNNGKYDGFLWCLSWVFILKKYDIIIIENRSHYAPFLRKLGYKGQIIVHMHNDKLSSMDASYLELLNGSVDHIISCSRSILNKVDHKGILQKSSVIYNGVDELIFHKKDNNKIPNSLLFVGRINENKGIHILIEAVSKLKNKFPDITLNIAGATTPGGEAGKSPYESRIIQLIDQYKLQDHVNFLGYLDHDKDLPEVYSQHQVFCLTSVYTEAFPLVVIESLFCETPVVASNVGGVSEAFEEGYFGLVQPGNSVELAQKIEHILTNKEQEKIKNAFTNAKDNFTWHTISNDFITFLKTTYAV